MFLYPRTRALGLLTSAALCLGLLAPRSEAQVPSAIRAKLQKRITLEKGIPPYTEFGAAIRQLGQIGGLTIEADKKAFQTELMIDSIEDLLVRLPKLKNVEFDAILRALLVQVYGVYEIRQDRLVVVPAEGREWQALPMTPERAKLEAEVRRKLAQKVALDKAVVAESPEKALALLSERFGVQFVSHLPDADKVRVDAVREATLGSILEHLLQNSSFDSESFRCIYEVHDNTVIVLVRPITLAKLLTPAKDTGNEERSTGKFPRGVENQVQQVLNARGGLETSKAYRTLFSTVRTDGIRRLQDHTNDGIALQAAWEEVRLTVPEKEPKKTVRPDSHRLAWFIGFVAGRLRVRVPQWWQEVVLDSRANRRDNIYFEKPEVNPYHRAGLDEVRCPRDTTLKREGDKIVLRVGKDSLPIPEDLLHKSDDGGVRCNVSALFTPAQCYVAVHGNSGYGFELTCIDRSSAKVRWKTDVWGAWWGGVTGPEGHMWVSVMEHENCVLVFGAASMGIHIEGFRPDNGANLFRFSSSY
jgi:hypothetical protein